MNNETNPKTYESVIASFDLVDGKAQNINLYPITLGFELQRARKGTPEFASVEDGERILKELQKLSCPFGTTIEIKNGVGIVVHPVKASGRIVNL
jgi:hypothetical protein